MKKILQLKLKILAKMILAKYKPDVIGITGSVGKTSTKEAVYEVLSSKFNVRRNIKNYNNEIGLPLTIIGSISPGKSIIGWGKLFFKAFWIILFRDKNYPNILVLEMGIDKPGDMSYLLNIAKCKIGIVTAIGSSHLKFFDTIENIKKEKGKIISSLIKDGVVILNYDDEESLSLKEKSKSKVLTYGFKKGANVQASDLFFNFEKEKNNKNLLGISFKLSYQGSTVPVFLQNSISYGSIYSVLVAFCVGTIYDFNLIEISQAVREIKPLVGRMNLIKGIKNTLIIDDSYNSSPQSLTLGLNLIKKIKMNKGEEKFAVLGDMLELGSYSEREHNEVGKIVFDAGINKLITVGERSRDIGRGAMEAGMNEDDIFNFSNSEEAGLFVQKKIREGDLIFIKGSQGVRMEKITKEIMAEPLRAEELLVRQGKEWIN